MTKLQDYRVTLHRLNSDVVAMLALHPTDATAAIFQAHPCRGQDWYVGALQA